MNSLSIGNISYPSVQNFNAYKSFVASIPNLNENEERELLSKFKLNNCLESVQKLILSQLKTVVYLAYQFKNYGLPEEDLVQEGNIGLMKAVKNFDLSHKVRLYSYALIWIKAEMQGYILKNWKLVKIGTTKNLKKLFFNYKSVQKELIDQGVAKNQIVNKISEKLNVDIEDVREMSQYFGSDDLIIDLEKEDSPILQIAHDTTPELSYMESHDAEKASVELQKAIKELNENQQKVINFRFFEEDKKTHKEIAKILNISSERVRQIEVEALNKMRKLVSPEFANNYV
jgi:RNA polymerase sigma-32 factor